MQKCKNSSNYQTKSVELRRRLKWMLSTVGYMSSFEPFSDGDLGVRMKKTRFPDILPEADFKCSNQKVINQTLVNDLVSDCNLGGEDEPILVDLLADKHFQTCTQPFELPCVLGHSKCYNVSDICLFKMNKFNRLEPCSNGGHIQSCGSFECNRGFKCSSSYCIPWGYV